MLGEGSALASSGPAGSAPSWLADSFPRAQVLGFVRYSFCVSWDLLVFKICLLLKIYKIFSHSFGIWYFSDCQESFLESGELSSKAQPQGFFSNKNFLILAHNFFFYLVFSSWVSCV